jgi:hypothetical protein
MGAGSFVPDSQAGVFSLDISDIMEPSLGISETIPEGARKPLNESSSASQNIPHDSEKSHLSTTTSLESHIEKENVPTYFV